MSKVRGRPAYKTYLFARQPDLFPSAEYTAYLENRYPYLRLMREVVGFAGENYASAASGILDGAAVPPVTNRGGKVVRQGDTK